MRIYKIDTLDQKLPYYVDNKTKLAPGQFTSITSYLGSLEPSDRPLSFAVPYVTGSIYNTWWLDGIDFSKLDVVSS